MCDTVAGELILCLPTHDPAARSVVALIKDRAIEHVEYAGSLEQKLHSLDLKLHGDLEFEFHLVRVPSGQEAWKTTYLQFHYKRELLNALIKSRTKFPLHVLTSSNFQFTVSSNHILTLASPPTPLAPVSASTFQFGPNHSNYKKLVGLPLTPSSQPDRVRVLVLDSGLAADARLSVADRRNFVDPRSPGNVTDDHGHGTAVALLIHDLAPNAEFIIYKVADASGRISEWDALAAIAARTDTNVINLSMQFGLLDQGGGCGVCGRESQSSRSAIFENMLDQLGKRTPRPIVIAAAGNYGDSSLAFPARFAEVIAIGSVTSQRTLSSNCNSGGVDQAGKPHQNHFVLPGGEKDPAKFEAVLTSSPGKNWSGSSFATAFASGLVAQLLGTQGLTNFNFDLFLDRLRHHADARLPGYSSTTHGNGLMHV
jgi:subtilisin family serine protease